MKKAKLKCLAIAQIFLISTILLINTSCISELLPVWKTTSNNSIISINTTTFAWDDNGVAICTNSGVQSGYRLCSDGTGGAIISWYDGNIWAQRINIIGDVEWTTNGVAICTATGNQIRPEICSDGNGGAFITWEDERDDAGDIYIQKVNSSGDIEWTLDGVVICNASNEQNKIQICSDGIGGAIIGWEDRRSGDYRFYIQKVNSSGGVEWTPNGIFIVADGEGTDNRICSEGAGGVIVTWGTPTSDIYARKFNTSGSVEWTVTVCSDVDWQYSPAVCSDGEGGAVIVWHDMRNDGGGWDNADLFVQKINSSGSTQWTPNGVAVSTASWHQYIPNICSDGEGGAMITWRDERSGSWDVYAQKINATGGLKWNSNGLAICTLTNIYCYPGICQDGAGGATITWFDNRTGDYGIYIQKVDSSGAVEFIPNGSAICTEDYAVYPQILYDGGDGAFIAWMDNRSETSNLDIYAQYIIENDPPTSNQPADIITTTSGSELLYWVLYDDYSEGKYRIWVNDTNGNFYLWAWDDWNSWTNDSFIIVPINRTAPGIFNYTIEYYDFFDQKGVSDTVIVQISTANNEALLGFLMGTQKSGDISSFLFSPLAIGIIASLIAAVSLLTVILIKYNRTINEKNKKIKRLHNKIGKSVGSKGNFKNPTKKKV